VCWFSTKTTFCLGATRGASARKMLFPAQRSGPGPCEFEIAGDAPNDVFIGGGRRLYWNISHR